jgi:NAD(P)-dependent dehydrogenase (short-subunit alcohol dehydrogenase family)
MRLDLEFALAHSLPGMTDTPAAPVTLITGGGTGIGAATARQLLERGHRVIVTGRRADRLHGLAADLGHPGSLLAVPGDAADYADVTAAVQAAITRFGRLDTVVANAAYRTSHGLAGGDPAGWRQMVLTNVLGPALLVRAARRAGCEPSVARTACSAARSSPSTVSA